jgi:glycerophosphoryl diester phosphodiesterase
VTAYFADGGFQAYAHRGGAALWPQNTLEAFRGAADLGYRYIETDVQATRDGVLVLFHDPDLGGLTDGRGPVGDLDWDDARRLDAAYSFDPAAGYPLRGCGVRIPTLEEVLAGFPDVSFTLELKIAGIEQRLFDLLERTGRHDSVIVGSFLGNALERFRAVSGGRIATSATRGEVKRMWAASRFGLRVRTAADAFQVPPHYRIRVVDRRFVRACHRAGAKVHVWTVDDPEELRTLLDAGVDGMMSDRPDLLRDVLRERGTDV